MIKKLLLAFTSILLGLITLPIFAEQPVNKNIFSLHVPALAEEKTIPINYTCDGKDISPSISWSNAPAGTQSFALILSDPDASSGTFYHWVLYNIPATVNKLAEGTLSNATMGLNSWGKPEYNGPCPPKEQLHHYIFTLYALDTKLDLPTESDTITLLNTIKKYVIAKTELTSTYERHC